MALNILEKYDDSWRIDHPCLEDVGKTTYALGVITGFNKIFSDPLVVTSQVKVTIDGVESGLLPLFYHPKAQYWDPHSQTLGGEFHEKAWMSFRIGDEVMVMLREGAPVAVLGFADGKPRIGEDIIKSAFKSGHFWRASLLAPYAGRDTGPDGVPLGLATLCPRHTADTVTRRTEAPYYVEKTDLYGVIDEDTTIPMLAGENDYPFEPGEQMGTYAFITYHDHTVKTTKAIVLNSLAKVYYYPVVVGPILYLVAQESMSFRYSWDTILEESDSESGTPDRSFIIHLEAVGYPGWIGGYIPAHDVPEQIAAAQAWRDFVTEHHVWYNPYFHPLPEDAFTTEIKVFAALYTPDLLARVRGAKTIPPEFVEQLGMSAIMQLYLGSDLAGEDQPDLQFFVKAVLNN
jgi:hypothetical protein